MDKTGVAVEENNKAGPSQSELGGIILEIPSMGTCVGRCAVPCKRDEISTKLATEIKQEEPAREAEMGLGGYKYTALDCLSFMLRRAEENQDDVARSRVTPIIMIKEIGSRLLNWR